MLQRPRGRLLLFAIPTIVPLFACIASLFPVPLVSEWLASRRSSLIGVFCLGVFWFFAGTFFAAQFLFPVRTLWARVNAWWCFLVWFIGFHRPGYVVRDGKAEDRLNGNRFGGWAGIVIVDSSDVAVMDDGLQYTRTLGPNAVQQRWFARWLPPARSSTFFLNKYEQVCGVVDLRRQRALRHVKTITRDGIEVECDLYVDFQIRRATRPPEAAVPYTYDERAVFEAVYAEAVRKEQGHWPVADKPDSKGYSKCEYRWPDAVMNEGAEELRNLIALYTLDQLYGVEDPDSEPHVEIERLLLSLLQARMLNKGVDVSNVMLGVFDAPPAVIKQRLETWKAEWERRQKIIWAQGESERERRREVARALAQLEMIETITQGLPSGNEALSKDIVTLRLIQSLEAMAQASAAREGTASTHAQIVGLLRRALAELEGSAPK